MSDPSRGAWEQLTFAQRLAAFGLCQAAVDVLIGDLAHAVVGGDVEHAEALVDGFPREAMCALGEMGP